MSARWISIAIVVGFSLFPKLSQCAAPDFNRDVRPILSGRCYKCHGPDEASREAGLRLDEMAAATAMLDSGAAGIVSGKPDESGIIDRVASTDPDLRMPPASEGPALTPAEIETLRNWIQAGANYDRHWSYTPPSRPEPPVCSTPDWCTNAIDRFILARLDQEQLVPQEEASKQALLRRVTLDLTGLPPTLEELDDFLADDSPEAYRRVVDRLLTSPAFGERWGRIWLDLARYADSAGYADDPPRIIWRYRDWVISALNDGMPFDQFTVEQIAGDLLPNATESQRIATGFHRNTMTNSEGGTDDEEFRNVAIVDRVNTTLQVWMGTTIMCAQCHTHKYDPITQEEYFKVFAILNQTADADQRDESPLLSVFTAELEARKKAVEQRIAAREKELNELRAASDSSPIVEGPIAARYVRIELPGNEKILSLAEVQAFRGGANIAAGKTATQSSEAYSGPARLAVDGNTSGQFSEGSTTHTNTETSPWWEVDLGEQGPLEKIVVWNRTDGGIGGRLNGFRIILLDEARQARWTQTVTEAGTNDATYDVPADSSDLKITDRDALIDYLEDSSPEHMELRNSIRQLKAELAAVAPITTPVMQELPSEKHRVTKIHIRGNFLDLGPEVSPGVPAVFHPLEGETADRLALAKWLVDEKNPLTTRVLVNRIWEQLFGIGIVETSEEFGLQGDLPSHPELLDWLAVETLRERWSVKDIIRLIVTSSTYQQSSNASPEALQRDPNNRLLARGPRFRLEAELVRDQALFAAGLLSHKMEGPSVKPPRPKLGLTAAFGASTDWDSSKGEDRYRRGIYTFWQRSIPYPSMDTFDAPSREVCTVRRTRTNTPLQALVTLNDPVYVEAAQGLARRLLREVPGTSDSTIRDRINHAYRICMTRQATAEEIDVLSATVQQAIAVYRAEPEEAVKLATDPIGPLPEGSDAAEAAAWTVVANVLLNLDETLTRR